MKPQDEWMFQVGCDGKNVAIVSLSDAVAGTIEQAAIHMKYDGPRAERLKIRYGRWIVMEGKQIWDWKVPIDYALLIAEDIERSYKWNLKNDHGVLAPKHTWHPVIRQAMKGKEEKVRREVRVLWPALVKAIRDAASETVSRRLRTPTGVAGLCSCRGGR